MLCAAVCYSVLLHAAVCCCVLLCAAVCCSHHCLHSYPHLRSQHTPFQVRVHMSESQVISLCVSTSYPCGCVDHIPVRVCACLCVSKSYPCVCVDHIPVRVCACLCVSKSYPCVSKSYGLALGRAAGHLKERKSGLTLG